jgi:hypothetical protein
VRLNVLRTIAQQPPESIARPVRNDPRSAIN